MNFEIREIKNLTGAKARVYSVILDGEENTLLEQFFDENVEYIDDLKKSSIQDTCHGTKYWVS